MKCIKIQYNTYILTQYYNNYKIIFINYSVIVNLSRWFCWLNLTNSAGHRGSRIHVVAVLNHPCLSVHGDILYVVIVVTGNQPAQFFSNLEKKNSWMSYKWNTSNNNVNVSMCHLQTHCCYQLLWLFHNQLLWFLLKTELQFKSDCSLSHRHLIIDYLIDDDTLQTYRPYRLNWTLHHVALRMTSLLQLSFVLNRRRNVQSVRDSL